MRHCDLKPDCKEPSCRGRGWLLAYLQAPAAAVAKDKYALLMLLVLALLVLGTFMDLAPLIIICALRTLSPFYAAAFVVLMLVVYVPALSLWLPAALK